VAIAPPSFTQPGLNRGLLGIRVILCHRAVHRTTDVTEKYFVRVDVTEVFPFLVTRMSPYFDRLVAGGVKEVMPYALVLLVSMVHRDLVGRWLGPINQYSLISTISSEPHIGGTSYAFPWIYR